MKYDFVSEVIDFIKKQSKDSNSKNEMISEEFLKSTELLLNMINDSLFPEFSGLRLSDNTDFLGYNESIEVKSKNDVNIKLKNVVNHRFNIHIDENEFLLTDDTNTMMIRISGGTLSTRGVDINETDILLSLECDDDVINVEKSTNEGQIFLSLYIDVVKYKEEWGKLTDLVPDFTYTIRRTYDGKIGYYDSTGFSSKKTSDGVKLFDLREYAVKYVSYCHGIMRRIQF